MKTSIKIIETCVCFVMGVSEATLRTKTRKSNIKNARHIIYYLHQCEFDVIDCFSQEQLSARYGQNHEIVVHAKKSIKQALEEVNGIIVDPYIKGKVKKSKELVQIYTTSDIASIKNMNVKTNQRNKVLTILSKHLPGIISDTNSKKNKSLKMFAYEVVEVIGENSPTIPVCEYETEPCLEPIDACVKCGELFSR